ncbi:DUF4279 domain-containing protein [Dyadobacter soli]|nr:DUF4279 domain-containing protein [Dyadobacter soli]
MEATEQNRIELGFHVFDFEDITHDDLTVIFGVNPNRIHIKGTQINPRFPRLAKANAWMLYAADYEASFEEQMDSLLDILEQRTEELKPICDKYYCEFSLALYIYNNEVSMPSVHLSSRYHALARKLNFEFDLDLYCLQDV